mmetsp:Transcript_18626/g.53376  ORF Transcript_18626/g.53376 Transcript_18626/m.53376 type:complete len:98 (+) Transcript_18626:106-399(+)
MYKETRTAMLPGALYVMTGDGQRSGPYWDETHLSAPRTEMNPFVALHSAAFKASPFVVQEMIEGGKSDQAALASAAFSSAAADKVSRQIAESRGKDK